MENQEGSGRLPSDNPAFNLEIVISLYLVIKLTIAHPKDKEK